MRFLKYLAIFMVLVVVLAVGMVVYFYASATVSIVAYKAEGVQAEADPERFAQLKQSVADGTFHGTVFGDGSMGEADEYVYITYTLRLSNQCLVPIDMVEVQVTPEPQDVLQLGDLQVKSLAAKSTGDITATLLTAKDSHAIRELVVTYYVWGVPFSIRETYGG